MAIVLWTLDDGAWISVDDSREVGVSDVWTVSSGQFCGCETAHVLLEEFSGVGVPDSRVVASGVGMCIDCGTRGDLEKLPVGRIVDGEFEPYAPVAALSAFVSTA